MAHRAFIAVLEGSRKNGVPKIAPDKPMEKSFSDFPLVFLPPLAYSPNRRNGTRLEPNGKPRMFLLLVWLAKKGMVMLASHYTRRFILTYIKTRITVKTERCAKALTAVETAVEIATTPVSEMVLEKGSELAVKYTRKITRKFKVKTAA